MTPRENLLAALRGEPHEWIPIVGHVDPYNQPNRRGMDPDLDRALGVVRWGDESTTRFCRHLGIEVMDWFGGIVKTDLGGVETESRQEGEDAITIFHTSLGDLRQVRRQCREDGTSYMMEHLLKTPEDLPRLAEVFEEATYAVNPARAEELTRRRRLIGEDGVVVFSMPSTPLGMLVRTYAGPETTAYLYADAPDGLRDLFAVLERRNAEQIRLAASCDGDAIVTVDDTSTTTISPAMFEMFCLDYTDRVADLCHEAGKLYFHHSCGHIRDLLDLYRRTRMDVVHAFTVPPLGNVTVAEGRRRLGPRIGIVAGIVQIFGSFTDWPAVQAGVRVIFSEAAAAGGVALGLAADPEKTMDDTRRLLDECRPLQRPAA
jgi:hypothetical protein